MRWSGDRWTSDRHRVLYEADWDAMISALQPPLGNANPYQPVMTSAFLRRLLDAIAVG